MSDELSFDEMNTLMNKFNAITLTTYDLNKIEPIKKVNNSFDKCISCNTNKYLVENYKSGILVCTNCGIVANDVIDNSAEWRNYDGENSGNARTSGIVNHYLPLTSMKTNISGTGKSFLKTANIWSGNDYSEKKIMTNMNYIQKICEKNKIPKCIEHDTVILYCKLNAVKHPFGKNKGKKIIMRGSKKNGFISACLFHAYKKNGINKLNKEIVKMFDIKSKAGTEGRKRFLFFLNIARINVDTSTSVINDYIINFCDALQITEEKYITLALKLSKNINKIGFMTNHKPISVAASIIYVIVVKYKKIKMSKKMISIKLDISEITLNKLYTTILSKIDKLTNDKYIESYIKKLEEITQNLKVPKHLSETYSYLEKVDPKIFVNIDI